MSPYEEFVDYNSGKSLKGKEYWKPMDDVISDYINHPESKFNGNIGIMERKHIRVKGITHIGKETNKLETSMVFGVDRGDYVIYNGRKYIRDKIRDDPYSVSYREAVLIGVSRSTLKRWRNRLKNQTTHHKSTSTYP